MNIPEHVAIIMDGNGRWARKRGLPRSLGHKQGVNRIKDVLKEATRTGVRILTLFAFSTENWNRPESEIKRIFSYMREHLKKDRTMLLKEDIRLRFFGRRDRLSKPLREEMAEAERATKECRALFLNIALDYGGRWDIANAARKIAKDVLGNKISVHSIDEKTFGKYVSLSDIPEPDLLIRTSGELRISNFLIWQLAYTELYFTRVLWPDFTGKVFKEAINDYSKRKRRFGKAYV